MKEEKKDVVIQLYSYCVRMQQSVLFFGHRNPDELRTKAYVSSTGFEILSPKEKVNLQVLKQQLQTYRFGLKQDEKRPIWLHISFIEKVFSDQGASTTPNILPLYQKMYSAQAP